MRWLIILGRLRIRWQWLAASVLAGILIHFIAVFAVTGVLPRTGMGALAAAGPVNSLTPLDPITPENQPVAFMMADTRYAVCPFDIRGGPVQLNASLGDDDWTIAIYGPNGDNLYAVSGADLDRRAIELILAGADDGIAAPLTASKDAVAASVTVGLSVPTGVAIISAPLPDPAHASVTDRLIRLATCQQRKTADGS